GAASGTAAGRGRGRGRAVTGGRGRGGRPSSSARQLSSSLRREDSGSEPGEQAGESDAGSGSTRSTIVVAVDGDAHRSGAGRRALEDAGSQSSGPPSPAASAVGESAGSGVEDGSEWDGEAP